jgi:hypothetical protein
MSVITKSEIIINKIYIIRNMKVMLDKDLAELYGVETKRLKERVRRNIRRFPDDFMFQLTPNEFNNLRSQFASSSWGGSRYAPMVFTEQGVAMLSSVLNSERAIQVNIHIMRAFILLRKMVTIHDDLRKKIEDMEKQYNEQFKVVFDALKQLLIEEERPKKRIGFKPK